MQFDLEKYKDTFKGTELVHVDPGPVDRGANKRLLCTLYVDGSSSMSGGPIKQLNEGLQIFKDSLEQDEMASDVVEVAIYRFGNRVEKLQDFVVVHEFVPPTVKAKGLTPMGTALELGIREAENRKNFLRSQGIQLYRPWHWLITDGMPTDDISQVEQAIEWGEQNKKLLFFAVGTEGADFGTLKQLSAARPPFRIRDINFQRMFSFLSDSLRQASSSRPGEQIQISNEIVDL